MAVVVVLEMEMEIRCSAMAQARRTPAAKGSESVNDRLLNASHTSRRAWRRLSIVINSRSYPYRLSPPTMSQKTCFVTIGATASFTALVDAALKGDFLTALEQQGYTDLLVQYGEGGKETFDKAMQQAKGASKLNISGFELDKGGLGRYMRQAKAVGASMKNASEGVVISHAGKKPNDRYVAMTRLNDPQAPAPSSTPCASTSPSSSFPTPICSTTTRSSSPRRWPSRSMSSTASWMGSCRRSKTRKRCASGRRTGRRRTARRARACGRCWTRRWAIWTSWAVSSTSCLVVA